MRISCVIAQRQIKTIIYNIAICAHWLGAVSCSASEIAILIPSPKIHFRSPDSVHKMHHRDKCDRFLSAHQWHPSHNPRARMLFFTIQRNYCFCYITMWHTGPNDKTPRITDIRYCLNGTLFVSVSHWMPMSDVIGSLPCEFSGNNWHTCVILSMNRVSARVEGS